MSDGPKPEPPAEPAIVRLSGADRAVLIRERRKIDRRMKELTAEVNELQNSWQKRVDDLCDKLDLPYLLGDLDLDTGELLPRSKAPKPAAPLPQGPPGSKMVAHT
jgi:hypothetical protein